MPVCTELYGAEAVCSEVSGAEASEAPVSFLLVVAWSDLECASGAQSGTFDSDGLTFAPAAN